jgi:replication factor C large subunit
MAVWTYKYKPKDSSEIQGQDKAISIVRSFLLNYKKEKKKAIILYGPSGSGKTSIAYALANETNAEIVEINASDYRKPDQIKEKIGNAVQQMSLFFSTKIILIDELEGFSGTKDRGGIPAIAKIIDSSSYPIIFTAENPYDSKFSTLKKKCELVELDILDYVCIFRVLKNICEKEGITSDDSSLKALARRSGGDMRSAINDLQILSDNNRFGKEELETLSERDQIDSIHNALMKVFKTTDATVAKGAFDTVAEDLDKVMLWIDENLPKEYLKPIDLSEAYQMLSRADVFKGRIRRWQHWRFLVYISTLLSSGVATAKEERYKGLVKYSPTTRILAIWRANMKYGKRKTIAEKIAKATHTSSRRVIESTLPYLKERLKKDRSFLNNFSSEVELDKDEVVWLIK